MWFGELAISECVGCILAHSQVVDGRKIGKGTVLDVAVVEQFRQHGFEALTVAKLDAADIEENSAASRLASAVAGNGTQVELAHTGRVNIYASFDGLLAYDTASVIAVNSVSPGITISVLAPDQWVLAGRMIASAKIIPYAVPGADLEKALAVASTIRIHAPGQATAALIQTVLPSVKSKVLDKTERVTNQRLTIRSSTLIHQSRCNHQIDELSKSIAEIGDARPNIILIVGASAISDSADVIPAAVEKAGGHVRRVGLPVDPGNLLMLAEYKGIPVLGLPGCARSPSYNGFDLLLDRIVCNVEITDEWLNELCIGGLLGELHDRPQPRVASKSSCRIAALVLAAGSSRRAGNENKLLHLFNGNPMVCSVVEAVLASNVDDSLVVTGHQSELIMDALNEYEIELCHCSNHSEGMAHTIATGLSRLQQYDAVIVCLGDMPHVDSDAINQIIASQPHPTDKIIVPVFEGKRGNPVMVGRAFYDSLLQHTGDSGARFLIQQYPEKVVEVELSSGAILQDYDTPESLKKISEP